METYIEDDWENIVVSDLLSEREKKLLEERRKVEESDTDLSKDLFSHDYQGSGSPLLFTKEKPRTIEIENTRTIEIENPRTRPKVSQIKNQSQQQQNIKQKKIQNKRISEIFGESNIDCHYELYGHIEDKY